MKIRKISFIAAILCIISLIPGCKENIFNKYLEADDKTAALESISGTIEYNIKYISGGEVLNISITADYIMHSKNRNMSEMIMEMSMYVPGEENVSFTSYYNKESLYTDMNGVKIEQAYYKCDFRKYVKLIRPYLMFSNFAIKGASMKFSSGVTNAKLILDCEQLKGQLFYLFSDFSALPLNMEFSSNTTNISDVEFYYTINKNGYLSSNGFRFTADIAEKASMEINMQSTIYNPGEPVDIAPPYLEDYTYVEDYYYDFEDVL